MELTSAEEAYWRNELLYELGNVRKELAAEREARKKAEKERDAYREGLYREEFDMLFKEYAQETDERLSPDAINLKRSLNKIIREVVKADLFQRAEKAERERDDALAGQAVLLKALEGQACMCTSHRVCTRCEALTSRSGRVREIMAAVRIAPKLIDMLSQVPVEILWIRQCRYDLLDSEDAKLVLGACKTRLKVLNSAPGVNKEAT